MENGFEWENRFECRIVPIDIAEKLIELSGNKGDIEKLNACVDIVYSLRAYAQNQYNKDSFRIFYRLLEDIVDFSEE